MDASENRLPVGALAPIVSADMTSGTESSRWINGAHVASTSFEHARSARTT
jgi:hypothetical protein